jgi:hypothetical protein
MAATPSTSALSKLYIGTTATSGSGDTYTEISFITNMGEFGRTYDEIKFTSLEDRAVLKFKGQYDDGTMQLDLGRAAADAGQAAAIVARDTDFDYNFKVALNDASTTSGATPTTFIFKAKVMSYTTNVGNVNQVTAAKITLSIKSGSIVETPST